MRKNGKRKRDLPGECAARVWHAHARDPQAAVTAKKKREVFVVGEGGLTKAKLAAMGTSALLSYGWVSNLNAVCLTIVSWITFAKSSGLSPLAPQQWKGFLAVYAGYYLTIGTAMRPIRISIAVAITPFFDRVVDFFQGKFQCSKPVAFGVTVFFTNILGTCTLMFLGLRLATWVTGVPLLP